MEIVEILQTMLKRHLLFHYYVIMLVKYWDFGHSYDCTISYNMLRQWYQKQISRESPIDFSTTPWMRLVHTTIMRLCIGCINITKCIAELWSLWMKLQLHEMWLTLPFRSLWERLGSGITLWKSNRVLVITSCHC